MLEDQASAAQERLQLALKALSTDSGSQRKQAERDADQAEVEFWEAVRAYHNEQWRRRRNEVIL